MSLSVNLIYDTKILMIFAFIGIVIKLFFGSATQDGSSGPADSTIYGFGLVDVSILSMIFITFALASRMTNVNIGTIEFLKISFQVSLLPKGPIPLLPVLPPVFCSPTHPFVLGQYTNHLNLIKMLFLHLFTDYP